MIRAHEIDLFSPWREGPAAIASRHVGRDRELDAIRSAALAFAGGASPLPLYVFGSSGVGKSHLLTLAIKEIEAVTPAAEVIVTIVPEDTVSMRSASQLFAIMVGGHERQPWAHWGTPHAPGRESRKRHAVLFEDLDRQLRALGTQGRRELRRLLSEGPDMWIVGAGMTLPTELTGADEAFFGAFDPWPLEALDEEEASALLDRVAGESQHDVTWRALRSNLLTLAGGSPRLLVALGLAYRRERGGEARGRARGGAASRLLHRVVHQFTPQYRNQLRSLSPQAQSMVTWLSAAPREVGPSELAGYLGSSTTQMSVQARRLAEDGVLRHRSDGRQTWYRLADPLFRYWLEYRSARWSQTRVGWMASLATGLASVPPKAEPPALTPPGWLRMQDALVAALQPVVDRERVSVILSGAAEQPEHEGGLRAVTELALTYDLGQLVDAHLLRALEHQEGTHDLVAIAKLDRTLRAPKPSPREAFAQFVNEPAERFETTALEVLRFVLARAGHGGRWVLRAPERKVLATRPFLRGLFLCQGRLWTDPPLISPSDVVNGLEPSPVDAGELLKVGALLGHIELMRRTARALFRAGLPLPRCAWPRVLDAETSNIIARLMVQSLQTAGDEDAAARDALSWMATLARTQDPELTAVLSALERTRFGDADEVQQIALAMLLFHAPDRFEIVEEATKRVLGEQCARARQLVSQLGEAARGHLHPELAVIGAVVEPEP
jgi:hypothetical protein